MAAIVHPGRTPGLAQPQPKPRHLRLVPPPRRHRLPDGIYWRRRMAVLIVGVVLLAAVAAGIGVLRGVANAPAPVAPATVGAGAASPDIHVVQPGDTFWSIARALQPTGDVRPLVDRLVSAHGGGPLQVGDRIALPGG